MKMRNFLSALLVVVCLSLGAHAQTKQPEPTDENNLDTQLYLIVGTNQEVDDARLPASLEPVVRQLRATLPFKNYRLTATMINRVKN